MSVLRVAPVGRQMMMPFTLIQPDSDGHGGRVVVCGTTAGVGVGVLVGDL